MRARARTPFLQPAIPAQQDTSARMTVRPHRFSNDRPFESQRNRFGSCYSEGGTLEYEVGA